MTPVDQFFLTIIHVKAELVIVTSIDPDKKIYIGIVAHDRINNVAVDAFNWFSHGDGCFDGLTADGIRAIDDCLEYTVLSVGVLKFNFEIVGCVEGVVFDWKEIRGILIVEDQLDLSYFYWFVNICWRLKWNDNFVYLSVKFKIVNLSIHLFLNTNFISI